MTRFHSLLSLTLIALASLVGVAHAQEIVVPATATTTTSPVVVERPVIVTAVPAPKETISTPTGFINCFTVKAGWYQDVWIAEHRVCQYPNTPSGVAWVEGYWMCDKYSLEQGQCTNWQWKTARWEKTLSVY